MNSTNLKMTLHSTWINLFIAHATFMSHCTALEEQASAVRMTAIWILNVQRCQGTGVRNAMFGPTPKPIVSMSFKIYKA